MPILHFGAFLTPDALHQPPEVFFNRMKGLKEDAFKGEKWFVFINLYGKTVF